MKKLNFSPLLSLLITISLKACPACVGRITDQSPAFFSSEFEMAELTVKESNEEPTEKEMERL